MKNIRMKIPYLSITAFAVSTAAIFYPQFNTPAPTPFQNGVVINYPNCKAEVRNPQGIVIFTTDGCAHNHSAQLGEAIRSVNNEKNPPIRKMTSDGAYNFSCEGNGGSATASVALMGFGETSLQLTSNTGKVTVERGNFNGSNWARAIRYCHG